jgi:hypothetical protein
VAASLSRLPSPRRYPGPASASDTGVRQHWQGPGLSDAPSAHPPDGVEPVARVALEVERQVQLCDQFLLKLPRPAAGAVSSDSSADIDGAGLVTDLSSIMCTLPGSDRRAGQ